ncbi:RRM domain-containing protein [Chloropicon primus]|uniref:RRM domain-containing protein n=1 Tax=Chloropicon primus TaxID=1764295 RepID=A0A5B8MM34_9CHLO|nr:hypothetical protein A3770_06p40710 [Chloropicon primus]UPR00764.1 RRM domain-containing protein [Chloropicon primus]|eukprot:QDZ21553.1 hypothetical protein A3770_06p40710 [Chloropicon primus]
MQSVRAKPTKDVLTKRLVDFADNHTFEGGEDQDASCCLDVICGTLLEQLRSTNPKVRLHFLYGLSSLVRHTRGRRHFADNLERELVDKGVFRRILGTQNGKEVTAMRGEELRYAARLCSVWKRDSAFSDEGAQKMLEECEAVEEETRCKLEYEERKCYLLEGAAHQEPDGKDRKGLLKVDDRELEVISKYYQDLSGKRRRIEGLYASTSDGVHASGEGKGCLDRLSHFIEWGQGGGDCGAFKPLGYYGAKGRDALEAPRPDPSFWRELVKEGGDLASDWPVEDERRLKRSISVFVRVQLSNPYPSELHECEVKRLEWNLLHKLHELTLVPVTFDVPKGEEYEFARRRRGTEGWSYSFCAQLTARTPRELSRIKSICAREFAMGKDITIVRSEFEESRFSCCVCNGKYAHRGDALVKASKADSPQSLKLQYMLEKEAAEHLQGDGWTGPPRIPHCRAGWEEPRRYGKNKVGGNRHDKWGKLWKDLAGEKPKPRAEQGVSHRPQPPCDAAMKSMISNAPQGAVIRVFNVDFDAEERDIRAFFKDFEVVGVVVMRRPPGAKGPGQCNGTVFVELSSSQEAMKARENRRDQPMMKMYPVCRIVRDRDDPYHLRERRQNALVKANKLSKPWKDRERRQNAPNPNKPNKPWKRRQERK